MLSSENPGERGEEFVKVDFTKVRFTLFHTNNLKLSIRFIRATVPLKQHSQTASHLLTCVVTSRCNLKLVRS